MKVYSSLLCTLLLGMPLYGMQNDPQSQSVVIAGLLATPRKTTNPDQHTESQQPYQQSDTAKPPKSPVLAAQQDPKKDESDDSDDDSDSSSDSNGGWDLLHNIHVKKHKKNSSKNADDSDDDSNSTDSSEDY